MNKSEQDYIRQIYTLENQENNFVSLNVLAQRLNNTNQTTNEMVKKLEKKQLVKYIPYKGIKLTKKGNEEAISLIRTHRLWEYFLVTNLGYSWEEVDSEAHLLEHATSKLLQQRLYQFLNEPKFCPHGSPIPLLNGELPKQNLIALSDAKLNETYVFYKVRDNMQLLEYLNKKHLRLKDELKIIDIDQISDNIILSVNKQVVVIGINIAKNMFVGKRSKECV